MEELVRPWREKYRQGAEYLEVTTLTNIPSLIQHSVHLDHSTLSCAKGDLDLPPFVKGVDLIFAYASKQVKDVKPDVLLKQVPDLEVIDTPIPSRTGHLVPLPLSWETFAERKYGEDITVEVFPFQTLFNAKYDRHVDADESDTTLVPAFAHRCMIALLRGLESNLFQWDNTKSTFHLTATKIRLTGLSHAASTSLFASFLGYGTSVRLLSLACEYVQSHIQSISPTVVVVMVFVKDYLDYCEDLLRTPLESHEAVVSLWHRVRISGGILQWFISLLSIDSLKSITAIRKLSGVTILDAIVAQVSLQCEDELSKAAIELLYLAINPLLQVIETRDSTGSNEFLKPSATHKYDPRSVPALLKSVDLSALEQIEQGLTFIAQCGVKDIPKLSLISHSQTSKDESPDITFLQLDFDLPKTTASDMADRLSKHSSINLEHTFAKMITYPLLAHADIVKSKVTQLLYDHLKLQDHLDIIYQVFLFGNGSLASSLSATLFHDTSSISLHSSPKWPPGAAKLNMATRQLLMENIRGDRFALHSDQALAERELLGHIGLVIDPEEDQPIDRTSLHAFQFLRFGVRLDAPLDSIFTPRVMKQYSTINQFLLTLLRMVHVVNETFLQAREYRTLRRLSPTTERFRVEATTFIHSFTAHIFETVITTNYRAFEMQVAQRLEVDELTAAHGHFLETVINACLLSRRLEPLSTMLTTIFTSILTFSQSKEDEDEDDAQYLIFHDNTTRFIRVMIGSQQQAFAQGFTARFHEDN